MKKQQMAPVVFAAALLAAPGLQAQASPHESYRKLPFSNGFSPAVYDMDAHRVNAFSDHLYRDYDGATPSTDLCWDTYWGLNVDGSGAWLGEAAEESAVYEEAAGIVHVTRAALGMQVDEYYFSPFGFDGSIMVMLARVTNASGGPAVVSLYSLHNFHAGIGAPEAGFSSESVVWQGGEFREAGSLTGHTILYRPILLPSRRRTDTAASAGNPYLHISDPTLVNQDSTGGAVDDAVAAFQWFLGSGGFLSAGESQWEGVAVVYGRNPDVAALSDAVTLWIAGRDPGTILDDERTQWNDWLAAPGIIEGAVTDAQRLRQARKALVMMRMGQVREQGGAYGAPHGQIVASMPPGMWNITWPRDQAYAVAALSEAGFTQEAKGAVEFVLNGQAGNYAAEVGAADYLVSVCRYHGGGFEESDGDPATVGPNIEFDNFGLFLWSLGKYVIVSGDGAIVSDHREEIFGGVADILVGLIEPSTHLLAPDSSIWERHWNGSQKHFAYSNIMAAAGLCSAAQMAEGLGLGGEAARYMLAAREISGGITASLVADPGPYIAQSLEEIATGQSVDAAVVEALNFGLVRTDDPLYDSTLAKLEEVLWLPVTQRGYKRNDDGDWYDEQEWVFIDLRIALARRIAGDPAGFESLVDWVTAQSASNRGLMAELYDSANADYQGAVPMMGFGSGAYLLALLADPAGDSVQECLTGPLPPDDEGVEITSDDNPDLDVNDPVSEDAPEAASEADMDVSGDDISIDGADLAGEEGQGAGEGCGC